MNKQLTAIINQAIISFTFNGETFDVDCHIDGVKDGTPLYNALDAHLFKPLYSAFHTSWQFVPVEFWHRELPLFLKHQAH